MFSILRKWTEQELLKTREVSGTPSGRLTGGYIDDLVALGKCVWFCQRCRMKFNQKAYNYEVKPALATVRGYCDGCGEPGETLALFARKS